MVIKNVSDPFLRRSNPLRRHALTEWAAARDSTEVAILNTFDPLG